MPNSLMVYAQIEHADMIEKLIILIVMDGIRRSIIKMKRLVMDTLEIIKDEDTYIINHNLQSK